MNTTAISSLSCPMLGLTSKFKSIDHAMFDMLKLFIHLPRCSIEEKSEGK